MCIYIYTYIYIYMYTVEPEGPLRVAGERVEVPGLRPGCLLCIYVYNLPPLI